MLIVKTKGRKAWKMWEDSFRFTRCKDQLRRTGDESFDSLRTLNFLVFPSVKTHKSWQISWLLHLNWPWIFRNYYLPDQFLCTEKTHTFAKKKKLPRYPKFLFLTFNILTVRLWCFVKPLKHFTEGHSRWSWLKP